MKKLKSHFNKNGLEYTLMDRNDKVALFRLGSAISPDGYEVSRIHIMRAHKAFGVDFEESELLPNNDEFFSDGSGSFKELSDALKYFNKLSHKLVREENVDDLDALDDELIAECQTVGDNAF